MLGYRHINNKKGRYATRYSSATSRDWKTESSYRSLTQGKGEFSMEYSRYSPCMPDVQDKLIQAHQESQGLLPEQKKRKN
ncbi:Elongation factor G-1, mitochondrial [Homalodisca vitripennis]|nr:Elongation factor G-1, mitochondrial [Homalodisca vitripennis]